MSPLRLPTMNLLHDASTPKDVSRAVKDAFNEVRDYVNSHGGLQGETGPAGAQGSDGAEGPQGETGPQGDPGGLPVGLSVTTKTLRTEEKISETVLSGSQATVAFSSIPNTYTHLRLEVHARTDRSGQALAPIMFEINGDTTAGNYFQAQINASDTTVAASENAEQRATFVVSGATAISSVFGNGTFEIPYYADTAKVRTWSFSGAVGDSSGTTTQRYGHTRYARAAHTTDALTDISLSGGAGVNFVAGSVFTLWGIKEEDVVTDVTGGVGSITDSTATDLTGVLTGDGATVGVTLGVDATLYAFSDNPPLAVKKLTFVKGILTAVETP